MPVIPSDACGNGVIEPGEDCDTFSPLPGSVCRPKATAGACHLDCQRRADGTRPACPPGWGCENDDLCRAPAGDFARAVESTVGSAFSVMAADFDGDGRAELISAPPEDAFQRTHLSFHYFDDRNALAETRLFPKLLASPIFTDVTGDGRSDLLFSDFRVGILPGRSDRVWVPETFRSYVVPDTHLQLLSVYDAMIEDQSALLVLTTLGGVPGIYVPDFGSGHLVSHGTLPGPVDELSTAVTGDVIDGADSPCREAVLAQRDASAFLLLDVCGRDTDTGLLFWRKQAQESTIRLEPKAAIQGGAQIADLDGDGHLDVLIATGAGPYAAFGDGEQLGIATPHPLAGVTSADADVSSQPLAVGDFTGDGVVDFVFPNGLLVSTPTSYVDAFDNTGARWTAATIADMNGNGKPDVMAASSDAPGIDFFNGTGSERPVPSKIPTPGAVRALTVADLDGDLTSDLAFIATGAAAREDDSLMIAFGATGALLTPPVQVARIRGTEQLGSFTEDSVGNLTVTSYDAAGATPLGALTLLSGSTDRLPFAPYVLGTVNSEGTLKASNALALTVGTFVTRGRREVLALATPSPQGPYDFWLGPTSETAATTPVRLEGRLDPRLVPWTLQPDGIHVERLQVAVAAADLDGDGLDEAVWVLPADDGRHCGIAITRATHGELSVGVTTVLDEPCGAPAILPADADGDGSLDLALLTSAGLLVLWNDGSGGISAEARTVIGRDGDIARAFTVLPATAAEPFRFAYVTADAAIVVARSQRRRAFDAPRLVTALEDGTGITAGDMNGDGVLDVAIADAGNLSVLLSRLKAE